MLIWGLSILKSQPLYREKLITTKRHLVDIGMNPNLANTVRTVLLPMVTMTFLGIHPKLCLAILFSDPRCADLWLEMSNVHEGKNAITRTAQRSLLKKMQSDVPEKPTQEKSVPLPAVPVTISNHTTPKVQIIFVAD